MQNASHSAHPLPVPGLVPIIIRQISRLRAKGVMAPEKFQAQLSRLTAEELRPRGLDLVMHQLTDGRTRFVVQNRQGAVYEMIECNGECHVLDADSIARTQQ